MAEVWPVENIEKKTSSQIPRSEFEVRCKSRLSFLNKYFGLNIEIYKY